MGGGCGLVVVGRRRADPLAGMPASVLHQPGKCYTDVCAARRGRWRSGRRGRITWWDSVWSDTRVQLPWTVLNDARAASLAHQSGCPATPNVPGAPSPLSMTNCHAGASRWPLSPGYLRHRRCGVTCCRSSSRGTAAIKSLLGAAMAAFGYVPPLPDCRARLSLPMARRLAGSPPRHPVRAVLRAHGLRLGFLVPAAVTSRASRAGVQCREVDPLRFRVLEHQCHSVAFFYEPHACNVLQPWYLNVCRPRRAALLCVRRRSTTRPRRTRTSRHWPARPRRTWPRPIRRVWWSGTPARPSHSCTIRELCGG